MPNVSEGRDRDRIAALVAAVDDACRDRADGGRAALLHHDADADHHRTVFTLAGDADGLARAVLALAAAVDDAIDLRRHAGAHPRLGALDVVPIVPLAAAPDRLHRARAERLANRLGDALAQRFALPVFRYDAVRSDAAGGHPTLADLRRGGLERLAQRMALHPDDPARARPGHGPRVPHPRLGVTAVGVRGPLIAYNVVLDDGANRDDARAIAARVREAGGGPIGVRALGLALASRGRAQVSMNLIAPLTTPPRAAFDAVRDAAAARGCEAAESEIVGLAPAACVAEDDARAIRLAGFDRQRQVLETRLREACRRDPSLGLIGPDGRFPDGRRDAYGALQSSATTRGALQMQRNAQGRDVSRRGAYGALAPTGGSSARASRIATS
ncbi:MAG: glutamate formiminotransferase [Acidobacteriota bacterium]